ncbi:hypothetical protein [Skermanella aerolata]|nr:hypothetical protein [Skermanella aerolata]
MTEEKPSLRKGTANTQIIGFQLPASVAKEVKTEASQRNVPLNKLFSKIWETYQEKKRGS